MIVPKITAHVIGNGASRKSFDLLNLRGRGTVFGCNALYRDFADTNPKYSLPDYLVAIDNPIITEIVNSDFPESRFINPPEKEKWEPVELHWGRSASPEWNPQRPRSNAGMNAILESIKRDFTELYIFGFDSIFVDQSIALSNLYDGTECYDLTTRSTLQDTRNRLKYLAWVIENNSSVNFNFCYPDNVSVYKPEATNCSIHTFNEINHLLMRIKDV
jgi:hypothetical protein